MDLTAIIARLDPTHPRLHAALRDGVAGLEADVAAGLVRNQDFTKAKEIINRCIEESAESFLKSCPEPDYRKSWDHFAYEANASISSFDAHNLPAFIKRAKKHGGLVEYASFLEDHLLPLHALIQDAKPLIVKRGDARLPPKPKTAEQIWREANSMTCQCCARPILANTGTIAHHGYERPGDGWQTASCFGAKELPFEVDRVALGAMLERMKQRLAMAEANQEEVAAERAPVVLRYVDYDAPRDAMGNRPRCVIEVTRATWTEARAADEARFRVERWDSFDRVKAEDLDARDHDIKQRRAEIAAQQARYDGWKQTHQWSGATGKWEALVDG
ncbi:hypothetical protein [Bradyrhizobium sp. SBR1B]|uniref:hypothetical protein n=1 Tax=Bradyrhizobium sp. SBR1B TaxID=2663836 RepID=UPI001605F516|nr:hypothetical protein [Bradyrhizobium sp. SBR1B]MBB4377225.1 hypothetical protein [Bradyrhizobium sp. SBR1B]